MTNRLSLRLTKALDAVYRALEARPPVIIEGCPCCISTRGADALLTTPLRELTGQQLWRYVSGVFLTVGSERDFRYLLPRILEISITDLGNALDPAIVIGKLALANWRDWPSFEQQVVEDFLDAWFEQALIEDLAAIDEGWPSSQTEDVLCGLARAKLPLQRWLARLHDPDAAPVLADLKARYPTQMSAFWEDEPRGFQELSVIFSEGRA